MSQQPRDVILCTEEKNTNLEQDTLELAYGMPRTPLDFCSVCRRSVSFTAGLWFLERHHCQS